MSTAKGLTPEIEAELRAILNGEAGATLRTEPGGAVVIDAGTGDLATLGEACFEALARAGHDEPVIYRYGDLLSRLERGDDGTLRVQGLSLDQARHLLSTVARWEKMFEKGPKPVPPPMDAVRQVLATPDPPVCVLRRVARVPYLAEDGEVVRAPGFRDGVYLDESLPGVHVPERPGPEHVAAARGLIVDEMLGDFPFVGEAERAHAVAALFLPFVRDAIPGATPLHGIEKPLPGTGATLLVDAVVLPSTGHPPAAMTASTNEEEMRKRITAKLMASPSHLLLDNVKHRLDDGALAAVLTAETWEDRVLGASRMVRLPVSCVFLATANNPTYSAEIARRTVRIRLNAKTDRPWLRDPSNFRHPNLRAWLIEHRAEIVAAVLTLARAWHLAGRPYGGRMLGMYEDWSRVIGGILEVAGIPGFLGNLDDFYEHADEDGARWRAFVPAWWESYGTTQMTVATLLPLADEMLELGDGDARKRRAKLGYMLRDARDTQVDGLRLERGDTAHGGVWRWGLRPVAP